MPEFTKKSTQQKVKEITESIEKGLREMFESDRYQSYLSTMSRFHSYSVNNTLLIQMQRPNATHVAGFNAWRDRFERHVKKGERGIQIIAPTPVMKKIREAVIDPDTKRPVLDAEGKPVTEERNVKVPMFKPVTVFDVSQTEGKPLPELVSTLTGDVEHYDAFVEALRRSSPVPIEFEQMEAGMDGYFSAANQKIAIRPGMSQVQTVNAMVHEIGHSKLHDYDMLLAAAKADGGPAPIKKDRKTEEVEAESVSYTVCQYFGIETAENSFGYIADWSNGKELKELRASLEAIRQTSSALIQNIEKNYAAVCKERELDHEQTHKDPEKATPQEQPKIAWDYYLMTVARRKNDLVLMQVGDSLEAYGSDAGLIASALGFETATKTIPEQGTVTFTSFPVQDLEKHLPVLRESYDVTVVLGDYSTHMEQTYLSYEHERSARYAVLDLPDESAAGLTEKQLAKQDQFLSYATAVCDHAEELGRAGLITLPFGSHDKETFTEMYADTLRRNGPKNARAVLDDYAEQSGYPTPPRLLKQLDELNALWDSHLSYTLNVSPIDPNSAYISSIRPDGVMDEAALFSGPTNVCKSIIAELKEGSMTAAQARAMNRQWNESMLPPGPSEALYFVEGKNYVHIQMTDNGFDYTLYDADTKRLVDGGQFSVDAAQKHISAETMIEAALIEVCIMQGLDHVGYQECSLDRLDQLREANLSLEHMVIDEYPMPDASMEPDALEKNGCPDAAALLPLSRDRARELFAEGFTVFVIDKNGDPMMLLEEADITDATEKLFALERHEWQQSKDFRVMIRDNRLDHQAEREEAFLHYPVDAFAIYQISDKSPERRDRIFSDLESIQARGLEPSREHYDLIYTGTLNEHPDLKGPEDAFRIFNLERPDDFGGHSLSVSDIVALRQSGVVTYHYCDSVGFEEVPDFQKPENYLKAAEMALEDDYGMIDGIINNGPRDQGQTQAEKAVPSDQRPSVQERLRELQQEVNDREEQDRARKTRQERSI